MKESLIKTINAASLIVDDNSVSRMMAEKLIEATEMQVDSAQNGNEAIKKIKQKHYDIVFLDYLMPELNGIQTTLKLRKMGYSSDKLCIIALSANDDGELSKIFIEAGMNDVLGKPIEPLKLCDILLKWLPSEKIDDIKKKENSIKEKIELLKSIDALYVDETLAKNENDFEQYYNNIIIFSRNIPNLIKKLPKKIGDLDKFAKIILGADNILINAGAVRLSGEAEWLAVNAQQGNYDFCKDNVPIFVKKLENLLESMNAVIKS